MIKIFDHAIDQNSQLEIHKELSNLNYEHGESDYEGAEVIGLSSELSKDTFTFKILNNILTKIKDLDDFNLVRTYVNKFEPKDKPLFHVDSFDGGVTALYYANDKEHDLDELGGTQFYIADIDEIKEVLPIPGRIIIFSGKIRHRATSFRTKNRYTVAFKYEK